MEGSRSDRPGTNPAPPNHSSAGRREAGSKSPSKGAYYYHGAAGIRVRAKPQTKPSSSPSLSSSATAKVVTTATGGESRRNAATCRGQIVPAPKTGPPNDSAAGTDAEATRILQASAAEGGSLRKAGGAKLSRTVSASVVSARKPARTSTVNPPGRKGHQSLGKSPSFGADLKNTRRGASASSKPSPASAPVKGFSEFKPSSLSSGKKSCAELISRRPMNDVYVFGAKTSSMTERAARREGNLSKEDSLNQRKPSSGMSNKTARKGNLNHGERRFAPDESTVLEGTINADVEPERVTVLERNEQTSEGLSGLHASKTTDTSSGLRTSKNTDASGLVTSKNTDTCRPCTSKNTDASGFGNSKGSGPTGFHTSKASVLSGPHKITDSCPSFHLSKDPARSALCAGKGSDLSSLHTSENSGLSGVHTDKSCGASDLHTSKDSGHGSEFIFSSSASSFKESTVTKDHCEHSEPTVITNYSEPQLSTQPATAKGRAVPTMGKESNQRKSDKELAEPTITKEQREAKVTKKQKEPTITKEQREAKVTKKQKEPTVTKEQREAKVTKKQKEPTVTKEQREAKVTKKQKEPTVTKEPSELNVAKECSGTTVTRQLGNPKMTKEHTEPDTAEKHSEQATAKDLRTAKADDEVVLAGDHIHTHSQPTLAKDGNEPTVTTDHSQPATTNDRSKPAVTATDESTSAATTDDRRPTVTTTHTKPVVPRDHSKPTATADESPPTIIEDHSPLPVPNSPHGVRGRKAALEEGQEEEEDHSRSISPLRMDELSRALPSHHNPGATDGKRRSESCVSDSRPDSEHVFCTCPSPTPTLMDRISPKSLTHLREYWTPLSSGVAVSLLRSSGGSGPAAAEGESSGQTSEEGREESTGKESEEKREDVVRAVFFRDRRPSAVYFTPDKAEGFPWLTWNFLIHPSQEDLHPSPQQRLEAARDPNYILNLVLNVGDVIGQGQYGTVYAVTLRSARSGGGGGGGGGVMALKKLDKAGQESTVHALAEQRALFLARDCPFIVTLVSCFQTKLAFYLLLGLAEGGSLTDVLKQAGRLPEQNVRFYAAQLLVAVSYLHDRDILHRDLKVDNVLLDATGFIRLCDFGLSMDEFRDDDQVCSPCGTLFYVAPEVLRGEPYGKTADWWSYGVLLYQMATGMLPFGGRNIQELYIAVTRKEPFYPGFLSPDAISFNKKLLTKAPLSRPGNTSEQRQSLKDDPFFATVDWPVLYDKSQVPPELPKHCLLPMDQSQSLSAESDAILSASFPLELQDMTPAERDRQSKQTRSRSLDPTGLFNLTPFADTKS